VGPAVGLVVGLFVAGRSVQEPRVRMCVYITSGTRLAFVFNPLLAIPAFSVHSVHTLPLLLLGYPPNVAATLLTARILVPYTLQKIFRKEDRKGNT
jgi:hypothetical protein